jgi:hypothetical protein
MSDEEKEIDAPAEDDSDSGGNDEAADNGDIDEELGDADADTDIETSDEHKGEDADIGFWKQKAAETEARLHETTGLLTRHLSGADQRKAEQETRERLMAMSPEERLEFKAEQAEGRMRLMMQQSEFRVADANDRADYMAKAVKNPIYAKYADEVEKRIDAARKQGANFTREVMAKYVAGEKLIAAAEKGGNKKQKKEAASNVSRSKSSATKAVGDKKLNGARGAEDWAARMERLRSTAI